MKLPMQQKIYSGGVLIAEKTNWFTVGETRKDNVTCALCMEDVSVHKYVAERIYVDVGGQGAWLNTTHPHGD